MFTLCKTKHIQDKESIFTHYNVFTLQGMPVKAEEKLVGELAAVSFIGLVGSSLIV